MARDLKYREKIVELLYLYYACDTEDERNYLKPIVREYIPYHYIGAYDGDLRHYIYVLQNNVVNTEFYKKLVKLSNQDFVQYDYLDHGKFFLKLYIQYSIRLDLVSLGDQCATLRYTSTRTNTSLTVCLWFVDNVHVEIRHKDYYVEDEDIDHILNFFKCKKV